MAALYVATKIQDTHKKPREILMASYAVRFPELAAKVKALGGDVEMPPDVRFVSLRGLCSNSRADDCRR